MRLACIALGLTHLIACAQAPPSAPTATPPAAPPARQDPSKEEINLPALAGWNATLVHDNDVGIWTCGTVDAFEMNGALEAFGLDDKGRCWLYTSYSGKWTPWATVDDKEWLGSFVSVELDPRRPERELYTGGKRGNLYQIVVHRDGTLDTARIAAFPAEELHTAVAGELDPARPGNELLLFTHLGNVYDLRPREGGFEFDAPKAATLSGRVRQALVLPSAAGVAPWIAGVCRTGEVLLMRMGAKGLEAREIVREEMGFGRIALRKTAASEPTVLYVTRDDGAILRLEAPAGGDLGAAPWKREVIYAGPQGPRGLAAGRFDPDPAVETVATFGYSKRVELLSRKPGEPWMVEVLFEERDKGHWLETVEVDGRNATDELMGSGYGARVFTLSRPPGTGLPNVPVNPRPENGAPKPKQTSAIGPAPPAAGDDAVRVAIRAKTLPTAELLSPLSYRGGFETKTLLYETLVRVDDEGRIVPGLASSWSVAPDGMSVVLELRDGATFHDGTPVDAAAVALHLRRWLGLPEHLWLRAASHVAAVVVDDRRHVRLVLDAPAAVLVDLCAINPCSIRAPSALDRQGEPVAPIGSGPYRFVAADAARRALRYERVEGGGALAPRLDLVAFSGEPLGDAVDALLRGEVDVVAEGWTPLVPRARIDELRRSRGVSVVATPGSSVWYLSFRVDGGPCADLATRRAVARAIDRHELIDRVEAGAADPCEAWSVAWSRGDRRATAPAAASVSSPVSAAAPLRLLIHADAASEASLARAVVDQLARASIAAQVVAKSAADYDAALASGAFDLRLEPSWGMPYDPWISLFHRYLPPLAARSAAAATPSNGDRELIALVEKAAATTDPDAMAALAPAIQRRLDEAALIVPLYAARRIAVVRDGRANVEMGRDLYRVSVRAP